MFNADLYINGAYGPAANGKRFERINPVTGQVATSAAAATVEDAQRAADAATRAFAGWSQTLPGERRRLLFAAGQALLARGDEIVAAMQDEIGATEAWARFNVKLASDMLIEAGAMVTQIKGELIPSNRPGSTAMAVRVPVGVVLSMAPWNAPVILGVRSLAMPLACGNTVVMKLSELCPRTHGLIVEAIASAGFPEGVLNAVSNAPEDASQIVDALISHPGVRRINFTGSTRVGRIIAQTAAKHLKLALLELGGKAPFIVMEDADLDAAVQAAAFGAYFNQGQICMSTERIITVGAMGDKFAAAFAAKVATLKAGDPREGKTPLGSMVSLDAANRIRDLVQDAQSKGATLLAGGGGQGTLVDAIALDHVTPAMRLYEEESFGPVAVIIRAANIEEAISIANDSDMGLSSAVFSRDQAAATAVGARLETGICHINGPTVHDEAQMPFGGVKDSGYGRFGGSSGVTEFTELRWVTQQNGPMHYPI